MLAQQSTAIVGQPSRLCARHPGFECLQVRAIAKISWALRRPVLISQSNHFPRKLDALRRLDHPSFFLDRRQFCVPFYQRSYVWTESDQWQDLWDDIRAKADVRLAGAATTPHFLGAVVVEPQPQVGLKGVTAHHIIEGQQRLTTLQYILAALQIALREAGEPGLISMVDECRQNANPDTMNDPAIERHKVWPTFRDREHHIATSDVKLRADLQARFPAHFTQAGSLRKYWTHPLSLAAIWFFASQFLARLEAAGEAKPQAAEALASAILTDIKLVLI